VSAPVLAARTAPRRTPTAPAPAALPPALPADAPRAGFTIRKPLPGAHVLVCSGCRRAVGLASLRFLPGRLVVGCVACANGERVATR
jgi:hypothetical protein